MKILSNKCLWVHIVVLSLLFGGTLNAYLFGDATEEIQCVANDNPFSRKLILSIDGLDVFANDCPSAKALADWVEKEIRTFETQYEVSAPVNGVIVAIESQNDPWPKISDYDSRHADPTKAFSYNPHPLVRSRKYARSTAGPYFRLSFQLSNSDLKKIYVEQEPPPFVVFLITDRYFGEISSEVTAIVEERSRHTFHESEALRAAHHLYALGNYHLDLKLMNLQRREVLWLALIDKLPMSEEMRDELRGKVSHDIDTEWSEIYNRRPRD